MEMGFTQLESLAWIRSGWSIRNTSSWVPGSAKELTPRSTKESKSHIIKSKSNPLSVCDPHFFLFSGESSLKICVVGKRYKNQTVAVKIVHRGETPEEIARREGRFAREVAMLSKVQHKNLVKVKKKKKKIKGASFIITKCKGYLNLFFFFFLAVYRSL